MKRVSVIVSDAKREGTTPSGIFCSAFQRFIPHQGIYTNCHCFCWRSLDISVIFIHLVPTEKPSQENPIYRGGVFGIQTARRHISISKGVNTQSTAQKDPKSVRQHFLQDSKISYCSKCVTAVLCKYVYWKTSISDSPFGILNVSERHLLAKGNDYLFE